jgi:HlyD family secretion protein
LAALAAAAAFGSPLVGVSADGPPAAAAGPATFRTATVTRGDLVATVHATGTVEPAEMVDVGSQVTGVVDSLGIDEKRSTPGETKSIDYGSVVEKGTVLAQIDDTLYKAQVAQAKATLARAAADLEAMKVRLSQAEQDLKRAAVLKVKNAISDTDYDQYVFAEKIARANVGVAEATVDQCKAALDLAEANLAYTVVKAPIKGVVISRRVNVGQMVVSNLSASSLFLLVLCHS